VWKTAIDKFKTYYIWYVFKIDGQNHAGQGLFGPCILYVVAEALCIKKAETEASA